MTEEDRDSTEGTSGEEASLEGKGWDILVGGRENPFQQGGTDPFDQASGAGAAQANPFASDADADKIITAASSGAEPAPMADAPPEAFWDRGRGAESVEPASAGETGVVSVGVSVSPVPPAASPGIIEVPPAPDFGSEAAPDEAFSPPPARTAPPAPSTEVAVAVQVPATGLPTPRFQPSDPFASEHNVSVAVAVAPAPDLPTDRKLERQLITKERIDKLWEEINETYDLVINDVRGYYDITEKAIADLKKAREYLMAGAQYYDNAEQLVNGVKARQRLEEKVRQWSNTRGKWLMAYLILWLLLLSASSVMTIQLQNILIERAIVPAWMALTVAPGFFGGLGGVISALWVLIKHTTRKRDFDPIHTLWYIANPFMGIVLGVVTYFVASVAGGVTAGLISTGEFEFNEVSLFVLYTLCILVGFNQNVLWSLVDRIIKAVTGEKGEEGPPEPTDTTMPPPPIETVGPGG